MKRTPYWTAGTAGDWVAGRVTRADRTCNERALLDGTPQRRRVLIFWQSLPRGKGSGRRPPGARGGLMREPRVSDEWSRR